MRAAVRFFSRLGNTRKIAEALAEGAGTNAVSVADEPKLEEYVDVLFLGGAPYANIMAPELRRYAQGLSADMVGRVVLFTTSNWSRRTVRALRKILMGNGIPVETGYFYAHMTRIKARSGPAREFAKEKIMKIEKGNNR